MTNVEAIKNIAKLLDVLSKESEMSISISCYSDSTPAIFLHDNSDTQTEYVEGFAIYHCKTEETETK